MLKEIIDTENNSRVLLYDSPFDVGQRVYEHRHDSSVSCRGGWRDEYWVGRYISDPEHLMRLLEQPWPEGLETATKMYDKIKAELPQPKKRRRVRVLSDVDGDVEVDRAMRGESDMFTKTLRQHAISPTNIAIATQIGNTADFSAAQIFWRGAATLVVVDLLEEAGYSCELWNWQRSRQTYDCPSQVRDAFTLCKAKEAGEPLDKDRIIQLASTWFFRAGILSLYGSFPYVNAGCGSTIFDLGPFEKYFEVGPDMRLLFMPNRIWSEDSAIEGAKQLLAQATSDEE